MFRLAVLGGTKMGEALLAGLLASGWSAASEATGTARCEERLEHLRRTYGVEVAPDHSAAMDRSRELARGEPEA
jgi:pyrroline-5-carboxylate reductase